MTCMQIDCLADGNTMRHGYMTKKQNLYINILVRGFGVS